MPEGLENNPIEGGPGGLNMSGNMSIASPSRVLPRVEAGDVLKSWEEFAEWKQKTTCLLWFYGGMSPEGVVSTKNEVHSLILTVCCTSSHMSIDVWDQSHSISHSLYKC